MKITVIQIDESPASIRDRFERYEPQWQRFLSAVSGDFSFDYVHLLDGETLPDPAGLEAIALTGSAFGVYEHADWMDPLREFIRQAIALETPYLAVCFGHQITADALGGDVRKSEKGWGVGRQEYARIGDFEFAADLPRNLAIAASHQDQVITPPDGASVWLTSDFCPNAGLVYHDRAVTLQPHPEWDLPYSRALLDLRDGKPFGAGEMAAKRAALEKPLDDAVVGEALARVLTG